MALDSGCPLEPGVLGVDGQVKTTAAELMTAMTVFYPEDSHSPLLASWFLYSPSPQIFIVRISVSHDWIHCKEERLRLRLRATFLCVFNIDI